MADTYFDKLGWRSQSIEKLAFPWTGLQTTGSTAVGNTGSIEVDGNEVAGSQYFVEGATTAIDIRNHFSVGDTIYSNAVRSKNPPSLVGTITAFADSTHFTCGGDTQVALANNDYIFKIHPNSGELRTPLRSTWLYLDDADDGTYFYSKRFNWQVNEDFTILFNGLYGNRHDFTLVTDSNINNIEVVGSVNGNTWSLLKDFTELNVDGNAIAVVYDLDTYGVLPWMAIRTTGTTNAQSTHGDDGTPLKMSVVVVPHG